MGSSKPIVPAAKYIRCVPMHAVITDTTCSRNKRGEPGQYRMHRKEFCASCPGPTETVDMEAHVIAFPAVAASRRAHLPKVSEEWAFASQAEGAQEYLRSF